MSAVRAYVALGSNLGDRQQYLAFARAQLGALPGTRLIGQSSIEETAPLGDRDQPAYLNQMVLLETTLTPRQLLSACQRIEALAGRERRERWASRTLDLDVVRHGSAVVSEPGLTLPHPALGERPFWQRELAELTSGYRPASDELPPWADVLPSRLAHIERVVHLVERWGGDMGTPKEELERWLRAAWLHDALRDAPLEVLRSLAPSEDGPVELLHGPAAAARAEAEGETDPGVLDAVRYHSVGFAGWDMAGRVLYCADFLEPGRSFDPTGRATLAERFPQDPAGVLGEVVRRRMAWAISSGWFIPEPMMRFWNSLADASPSS